MYVRMYVSHVWYCLALYNIAIEYQVSTLYRVYVVASSYNTKDSAFIEWYTARFWGTLTTIILLCLAYAQVIYTVCVCVSGKGVV